MTIPDFAVAADAHGGRSTATCPHLGQAGAVTDVPTPPPHACEDCLREGSTWVHLRQCLACGGVRCCDNSPKRHATAHAGTTAHPLVRSAEPGEPWGWCYPDELFLMPAGGRA